MEALAQGPVPASPYAERVAATFPERDGRCAERVIQAVLRMGQPDTAAGQVPTPASPGTR